MRPFVLSVVLFLVSGCSGLEARDPLPPRAGPKVRNAAIQVSATVTPSDPNAFNTPGRFSALVDAAKVQERARAVLAERDPEDEDVSSLPARPTVEVEIARADAKYEGQTGLFVPKVIITVLFFPFDVPNYFISSDRFSLTLQAKWKLVQKGQQIAEGTAEGKQVGRFGDFSRGWYLFGYLRMPAPLKGSEWQEIADALLPGAQDALAESLVLEVEKALAAQK